MSFEEIRLIWTSVIWNIYIGCPSSPRPCWFWIVDTSDDSWESLLGACTLAGTLGALMHSCHHPTTRDGPCDWGEAERTAQNRVGRSIGCDGRWAKVSEVIGTFASDLRSSQSICLDCSPLHFQIWWPWLPYLQHVINYFKKLYTVVTWNNWAEASYILTFYPMQHCCAMKLPIKGHAQMLWE